MKKSIKEYGDCEFSRIETKGIRYMLATRTAIMGSFWLIIDKLITSTRAAGKTFKKTWKRS